MMAAAAFQARSLSSSSSSSSSLSSSSLYCPVPGRNSRLRASTTKAEMYSCVSSSRRVTRVTGTCGRGRTLCVRVAAPAADEKRRSDDEDEEESRRSGQYTYVEVGGILDAHALRGEVKVLPFTDYSATRFAAGSTLTVTTNTAMVRNRHRHGSSADAAEARIAANASTHVVVAQSRTSVSGGREVLLVKFEGIDNRNEAELLKGKTLVVKVKRQGSGGARRGNDEDEAEGVPDGNDVDEYYAPHLENMAVVMHDTQKELGVITDVYEGTGSYDTIKVRVHSDVMRELVQQASRDDDDDTDAMMEEREEETDAYSGGVMYIPFAKEFVPIVDMSECRCEITPVAGLVDLAVTNFMSRRKKKKPTKKKKIIKSSSGQPKDNAAEHITPSASQ